MLAHVARRPGRLPALLGAAMLVVGACTPTPQPSPSPTATSVPTTATVATPTPRETPAAGEAAYAAVATEVERIRDLRPTADIAPVVLDEATLRRNLEADFDRDNPPAAIAATERILKALGLLAPGTSLRDLVLDLQGGQIIGYYSPDRDQLFVVSRSGSIGPTERATYAHEYTHQLQDQNFDLGSLGLDSLDQGDRSLARLALVEGDAVAVQTRWMQAALSAEELGQVFADAADPVALHALLGAPAILRETILFPYQDGALFVARLMANGGFPAVDAVYADPPDATEQILHPDKYLEREAPIGVELPSDLAARIGQGWSEGGADTLGELVLRIWLVEGGVGASVAATATAGWGGDRLMLLDGPSGATAIALVSDWDSVADAGEFAAAARTALAGLGLTGTVSQEAGSARVRVALGANAAKVMDALRP